MKTTLHVEGMHCNSCKLLIEDVCSEFAAITACKVDAKTGKVDVEHTAGLDMRKLKEEIESLGEYNVSVKK